MGTTTISGSTTAAARTLIVQRTSTAPLTLAPRRRRHTVAAWLWQTVLDPRLAAGASPESGPVLATRATQVVRPRHRRALADAWDRVVDRASQPTGTVDLRVPVARRAVRAAAGEISALSGALRSARPVAARDVARAARLLVDGAGPVYTGTPDLRSAVAELVTDLTGSRDADGR